MSLDQQLLLTPAGLPVLQKEYKRAMSALAVLMLLVLLIACANAAKLMTAQAAARSTESSLYGITSSDPACWRSHGG